MSIKDILLKKGWAGRTISRSETIDRMNPILQLMSGVLNEHNANPGSVSDDLIRTLRMDIGKFSETIVSCGGVAARNAVDSESGASNLKSSETELLEALKAESEVEHQMRTRAIIGVVLANTELRIKELA
jgi:hypothetical protein